MKKYFLLAFALIHTILAGNDLLPSIAQAQTATLPQPSTAPLNAKLLDPKIQLTGLNVIRSDTISPTGLTIPSLWWAKEQFAGKLLDNWLAYPNEHRVDLVVNRQLWTLLDYIGRYSFINQLGTAAREYGYNTRVFILNQPDKALATYTCDFSAAQPVCNIRLESSGKGTLQRNTQ